VALGLALPVGLLDWGPEQGAGGVLLLVVTAVGGLALVAIGADLCCYAGAHVYEQPLGTGHRASDGAGTTAESVTHD